MRSIAKKLIALTTVIFLTAGFSIPAQAGGSNGHHYRHGGHHYSGHSSHEGAYLAGGLILGSLIGNAYYRNQQPYYEPYYQPYYGRRATVVVDAPVVTRSSSRISRRLLRDRDGNCFEKHYNDNGDEIMAELDPSECAW
jgi:hypothetical protein